jgi:hypothetical protein
MVRDGAADLPQDSIADVPYVADAGHDIAILVTGGTTAVGGTVGGTTGGTTGGGGAMGTGGATSAGGAPGAGGATSSGGVASSGGSKTTGGTSAGGVTILGGATSAGGTSSAGGTTSSGGSTALGGTTSAGGTAFTGGATSSGGANAGGATTVVGNIPPGYPIPTTANVAGCQTVAVSTTECTGQNAGDVCIECLFGGSTYNTTRTPTPDATAEAGNYLVTVTLGGTTAGQTYISAESSRGLLAPVPTSVGQMLEYAFVVNVREMEGQPNHADGPGGYPGLDLFFSGPAAAPPQVAAIGYHLATSATKPIMVYIASDGPAADLTSAGFAGWGQMLPEYFGPPVGIANYANSGASSASFYQSLAPDITSRWMTGDWVFLEFGYSEANATDATIQTNLAKYVADAQAAGVNAVLVSPPARVTSIPIADQASGAGNVHAVAAKQAAALANPPVPFIDLTSLSTAWYNSLGDLTTALSYHANGFESVYTNLAGAAKIAGLVAKNIKDQNLSLAQYLRQ